MLKSMEKTLKKIIDGSFLKILLLYSIAFVSVYTIYCTVVWAKTGQEPPTQLSIGVYGFFGTELAIGAFIRILKPKDSADAANVGGDDFNV